MSEHLPKAPERHLDSSHEKLAKHEHSRLLEASRATEKAEHKPLKQIEHIRRRVHEQALRSESINPDAETEPHKPSEAYITRELKQLTYSRLLNRARKSLSPPGRLMSRVIHQPVVEVLSEGLSKTVARPSGVLGGGILAFGGSLFYYSITKHYGYSYSYFVFLLLLTGGFVAGWVVELMWRLLRSSRT